jgi:hypothetical protein
MARLVRTLLVAFVATVIIAMAFTVAIAAPVAAVTTHTPDEGVKVTAGGWFISENKPGTTLDLAGHECHFGVVGMYDLKKEEWRGQGSFMDKNYSDGTLKAILTIDDGQVKVPNTGLYWLYGIARVSVDQEKIGEYAFAMTLEDWINPAGDHWYTVQMQIDLPGPDFLVWVSGFDDLGGGIVVSH